MLGSEKVLRFAAVAKDISAENCVQNIPSREWKHIPPKGKFGKSSTQNDIFGGICDRSLEGILFPSIWPNLIYFTNMDFPEMRKFPSPNHHLGVKTRVFCRYNLTF